MKLQTYVIEIFPRKRAANPFYYEYEATDATHALEQYLNDPIHSYAYQIIAYPKADEL